MNLQSFCGFIRAELQNGLFGIESFVKAVKLISSLHKRFRSHRGWYLLIVGALVISSSGLAGADINSFPACQNSYSDPDGDGWGWENGASCFIASSGNSTTADNVANFPTCQFRSSDADGDGWGWENGASCFIANSSDTSVTNTLANFPVCQLPGGDPDGDGWGWEQSQTCKVGSNSISTQVNKFDSVSGFPLCSSNSSDFDSDGWGWENNQSCVVSTASQVPSTSDITDQFPTCSNDSVDADGDGWGFEYGRSCLVQPLQTSEQKVSDTPYCQYVVADGSDTGWENGSACVAYRNTDITDLILVTGQSNVLGRGTEVDLNLDDSHPRVFAYTQNGWQVASLSDDWDLGAYRGTADPTQLTDREAHNNFALHFGKQLAALDSTRVIGIILVSEPGEGIAHWDPGAPGMNRVQNKVVSALNELPQKYSIDGLLWHQGETDWSYDGTADPDVTGPVRSDYYPYKLGQLITNLRNENWYDSGKPFICGETIYAAGVNSHLKALNSDNDSMTACVDGFGLTATNNIGSHFNSPALRTMGRWYAEQYYSMTR